MERDTNEESEREQKKLERERERRLETGEETDRDETV